MNNVVRLTSITLNNFKNAEFGIINMTDLKKYPQNLNECSSDILGIYGQNGSGKTAVIDALMCLKLIIMGKPLSDDMADFVSGWSDTCSCIYEFFIQNGDNKIQLSYQFVLKRESGKALVESEIIFIKYFKELSQKWSQKTELINTQLSNEDVIFTPNKQLEEVIRKNKKREIALKVAKGVAKELNKSFIFSVESNKVFEQLDENNFINISLNSLKEFASTNLFVVHHQSGIFNTNTVMNLYFKMQNDKNISTGEFPLPMNGSAVVDENGFKMIENVICGINDVIKTIIPGLTLEIRNLGAEIMDNGLDGNRFEVLACRDNLKILLRNESEGIKKIVSILSLLIEVYNNPSTCLAVDELDAGVFEYLLGELLQIIEESGKGQLIFTSHNLRPLEMINKNSIVFTTTNKTNRYIKFKGVKGHNNLRDMYLRSILLDGQSEEIYDHTKNYEIRSSLRNAGCFSEN